MANTIQELLAAKAPDGAASQQQIQYMDTVDAYNKWAEVYDTDANFLQGLDTIEMRQLLPRFLSLVTDKFSSNGNEPIKLVDLGCGTGRNTLQLLRHAPTTQIVGLDASPGMLDVARSVVKKAVEDAEANKSSQNPIRGVHVQLEIFDLLQSPLTPPSCSRAAAGVISTLVLEHIPLTTFFQGASALLRPGGYLLVTNMHSDMGSISQAGFVDPVTGTKIRPTSYCHTVAGVLVVAEACGFQLERLGSEKVVREREVNEALAEVLGKRAKKWIGVKVWFGACFRKKEV